jgi:hypothetical protein
MNIQFQIVDIFHFSAGYTVFAGALSGVAECRYDSTNVR